MIFFLLGGPFSHNTSLQIYITILTCTIHIFYNFEENTFIFILIVILNG